MAEELERFERGIVLHNIHEARMQFDKFVRIIRSKDAELRAREVTLKKQQAGQAVFDDRLRDREQWYLEERRVRQYYQKIVLKLARDLKLFEEDSDKKEKFEEICEKEDDLSYQKQVRFLLDHIGLQDTILAHVNRHHGMVEGLTRIKENLGDLGLVDLAKPSAD